MSDDENANLLSTKILSEKQKFVSVSITRGIKWLRGNVGLLDWYTVPTALLCVLILTAHGATYLTIKTEGAVHERSVRLDRRLWLAAIPAFVVITLSLRSGHRRSHPVWGNTHIFSS